MCVANIIRHGRWLACINPLNAELNPICPLLALLRAHHILYVSRMRVKVCKCIKDNNILFLSAELN
jgi:hypothetical protein